MDIIRNTLIFCAYELFVGSFGIETTASKKQYASLWKPFQFCTNSAKLNHRGPSLVLICANMIPIMLVSIFPTLTTTIATCLPCWARQPRCASVQDEFRRQSFSRKCLHLPWDKWMRKIGLLDTKLNSEHSQTQFEQKGQMRNLTNLPVPVGSPPWIMNSFITRWNFVLL